MLTTRTKAIRPANSRLDTSRLRQAFGVSIPGWSQAMHRELDRLIRLG
ncbi:sugar nucleotide-binding protein [Bradyrhizobium sp. WSM471]|nr:MULTISPECIES: sugar nucleotide-binding protein [Bradyrhizobium]UFW43412.1 sugar nucleotide-binding protein [Bradyrhizobium canariense]